MILFRREKGGLLGDLGLGQRRMRKESWWRMCLGSSKGRAEDKHT